MTTTILDRWHIPLPSEALTARPKTGEDCLALIEHLDADRMQDALVFLSGYAPGILDAILTATEACLGDLSRPWMTTRNPTAPSAAPAPACSPPAATSGCITPAIS